MCTKRICLTIVLFIILIIPFRVIANSDHISEPSSLSAIYDDWFGIDSPPMSQDEFESIVCITSAASVGILITIVGGTAIAISGTVSGSAGTAIALPLLVSSMWAACSMARSATSGAIWLKNRSKKLVHKLENTLNTPSEPPMAGQEQKSGK